MAVPPGVATEVAPAQPVAEAATAVVEVKRAVLVVARAVVGVATAVAEVKRAVLEMAPVQPGTCGAAMMPGTHPRTRATGHLRCGHDARWSEI